jgi:MoxR-like ATPase
MDRFAVQLSLGYVAPEEEVAILSAQEQRHPIDTLAACVSVDDVLGVRRRASGVRMSDELKRYVVDVVRETRAANGIQLGASPRASLALMKAAQALALTEGREFVIPEDVREMAVAVIAHRMVAEPQARFAGVTTAGIVEEILTKVPLPS